MEENYHILEMSEAIDGLGIATERFVKEKEKKLASPPIFSGTFLECYQEKQKLLKRRK